MNMNMNYGSVPFEANYSDDIIGMPAMGSNGNMPMGMSMGMPMGTQMSPSGHMQMPMTSMGGNMSGMPMCNMGAMGMPMSSANQMSYPMPSQPMGMMQAMQPQATQMSVSQLPPGAVTPLNSVSVMPLVGGAGGIDAGAMNVVVPDLQATPSSGSNQSMSQMHQCRMAGGASATGNGWMQAGNSPNQIWSYDQVYPSQHQYHHHHHHQQMQQMQKQQQQPQQQQNQQNQQNQKPMKSQYDCSNYKGARNGLNSPSAHDGLRQRNSNAAYMNKKGSNYH